MEGTLVEDSTSLKLVPSLETVARSLKKNANHHEHVVALSIVIMGEIGFRVDNKDTTRPRDATDTLDPDEWRCYPGDNSSYQLKFKHESKNDSLDCKLVAVPIGDVLVINLCPLRYTSTDITRSVAFPSFRYINPYSSDSTGRFMNLRELSHRFKDGLTTPLKGEILTNAGITNASLLGLPTELKLIILRMLGARDIGRIAQSCREFRNLSALLLRR